MDASMLLLAAAASFLFGGFFVQYLTCMPRFVAPFAIFMVLSLGIAIFAITQLSGTDVWIGIAMAVLLGSLGYSLMARFVLGIKYQRPVPEPIAPREKGANSGPTAIVYFSHGESQFYEPMSWVLQFREFDEQGVPFMPFLARPFFLLILRSKYKKAGKSNHTEVHERMMRALERRYRDEGDKDTRFYLSFLDSDPRVDGVVAKAVNEGAGRVVVAEVFLTDSNHTQEGKHQVERLGLGAMGIDVKYTRTLWNSEKLHQAFLAKADRVVPVTERGEVGVLLVGHGQPKEWDREFPTETEHENNFRNLIMDLFVSKGYKRENVSLAWMAFRQPSPQDKVEELVAKGVKKVIYFSAAISADAIHSQCDIPDLVQKARVGSDVELLNLGAWNDDPLVIDAIKERVDEVL
jgi:sirohydrochlorin ferrochelatase